MRTNFDLSPYRRSTVGFDRLFDLLETAGGLSTDNYPPFDLEQQGEDGYRITLAVAGFGEGDIDITAQQNLLVVTGRKQGDDNRQFVHRGIAARSFERRFGLADYVQVKRAELKDGLLSIELVREIPEAMKPRKIAIGAAEGQIEVNDNSDEQKAA
jgi:molecular chaperone IbpA